MTVSKTIKSHLGKLKTHRLARLLSIVLVASAPRTYAAVEGDLACCYAPSYAASVGGEDNAQVIIANAVAGSNAENDQGGTGAHLRIAGFYMSANDPVNATTTGGMVGWLSGDNANVQDVVAFGATVGADLVTYICQNSDSASIAAVSQQPGVYSAFNPGAVFHLVVAHEIGGHNFGAAHSDGLVNPKTIMLYNYCTGGSNPYYTNPNIWFNGVQLIGDTNNNCSMGALINGGDNAGKISSAAEGVADRSARVVVGPNLNNVVLHWSFTNAPGAAPAGTTISDQVSAAPAIVRGNGAIFTGTALRIPGGTTGNTAANSIAAYIDLPNGILSARTNITIEIWATPLSAQTWARICDFGRAAQAGDGLGAPGEYTGQLGTPAPGVTQASDSIFLSAVTNTDITAQRFDAELNSSAVMLDSGLATTAGVRHYYTITFVDGAGSFGSAGGRWQWYRDGDPVAYLDVNFHLAAIEDVNNWLGRSQWSADSLANNDYAEVRISSVAFARGEVLANYLLGPNYVATATVTLTNTDGTGASSFNAAGQWSNGAAPSSGNSYETYNFQLRTPATSGAFVFAGDSLEVSGGALLYKGTSSSTITITNLTLNGGALINAGSGVCTLAGNVTVTTNGATVNGVNAGTAIAASISGNGPMAYLGNAATLSGAAASFTGKTLIGNGVAGTLVIDSQTRLGPNPATFTSDQLTLNRGTLVTTTTMALDDSHRGILLDVSGGTFNVASGTTLTLSNTLSSPVTPANVVAGSLTKAGGGTLILNTSTFTFKGTLFVDTSSTSGSDGFLKVVSTRTLVNAHSPIFIRNNNGGSSTLQLDGTAGNITVAQGLAVNCRNNSVPTIENLAGTNTIRGAVTVNTGGNMFNIQSDAGQLILSGSSQYLGSLTGGRTYDFAGAGDHLVSGAILNSTNGAPISLAKSGSGRLTLSANNTYGSTTTVSGGALLVDGAIGSGAVTVSSSTLGGNGTINGPVTVQSGGTLSPGDGVGTLTINNNLVLNSATTLSYELGSTSSADRVVVVGNLTLGGILNITTNNTDGLFGPGDYTLITYSGTLTDNGLTVGTVPNPALTYGIVAGGGTVVLHVTSGAVPGSFEAWQQHYGLTNGCPTCGGSADFDGDGVSNTNEFLSGFNPLKSSAYAHIISVLKMGDDMNITYLGSDGDTTWPGGPASRSNVLEYSVGTPDGSYTNAFTSTGLTNILSGGSGMGTNVTVTDVGGATNSPSRFYRIRVLAP